MSNEAAKSEQSAAAPDANVTGAFEPAAPPPSVEEQQAAANATGEFVPVPDRNPDMLAGTEVHVPDGGAATGEFLPLADGAPTAFGGTGEYVPDLALSSGNQPTTDATGAYVAGSFRDMSGNLHTDHLGATGEFSPTDGPAAHDVQVGNQKQSAPAASLCGRYVLKRFHARGGMGEIWLAQDPAIGRSVALKRMLGKRKDQQRRFRIEAQVTGQLEHPGIVPVHELGINEQGLPFYAMKFVHGRTLQKVIKEYHQPQPNAANHEIEQFRLLQIFISLCQTVAYAHSRGVLHRDLKPENVMLGPYGETLLLDWGIAKVIGQPEDSLTAPEESAFVELHETSSDTETQAGTVMGSPSYMGPEVALGLNEKVDQRSDVYLLGATLYEVLTGRPPREGKSAFDMIMKAQKETPPPPRKINADIPKAIEAICLKAMAFRQADRYQTALELAEDVQRFVAGEPVLAYREGFSARAWRWIKRHRKALVRSVATLLVLGLTTLGIAKYREIEQRRITDLRAESQRRQEAQDEAERLTKRDQARRDLIEFRRLADEARFFAATTEPASENSPYFDPREGAAKTKAALALARTWGPALDDLPLRDQVDSVKKELYDLLLLQAQARGGAEAGPPEARETLALLDEAAAWRKPSRSYYQFRAHAHQILGAAKPAAEDEQRATDPATPTTSLDHFLLGEKYRKQAASRIEGTIKQKVGVADPELTEKAIVEYRAALRIDPNHYWSHLQLGRCHMSLGRYAEAVEALGACIALLPESPWGYTVRGSALALQKRFAEAEQDLDKAVSLSPDPRAARVNRGVVYWNLKKNDRALSDFDAILQLPREKRLIEAAFYRGQLYLQLGEVKKALADFDLVAAESPGLQRVFLYRARIHIAQKDDAHALADLDTYLSGGKPFDKESWQAHGKRGSLLTALFLRLPQEQRQQPASMALATLAVKQLKAAWKLGAQAPEIYFDLGVMLEVTGQLNDAIAAYSQGLERAPKDVKLLNARGWAYAQIEQHEKGMADFAAAAGSDPENAEAHSGLGYVRALQKLPPAAQREADLALLHGADNHLILHNVACIYAALAQHGGAQATGYKDVAIALLRRALKLWRQGGRQGLNEIDLIKNDPTFRPLNDRAEFNQLIRDDEK